eukprot:246574-Chlamydomonas_euryale.AAC.3
MEPESEKQGGDPVRACLCPGVPPALKKQRKAIKENCKMVCFTCVSIISQGGTGCCRRASYCRGLHAAAAVAHVLGTVTIKGCACGGLATRPPARRRSRLWPTRRVSPPSWQASSLRAKAHAS